MGTGYAIAYRLGFTPWERAGEAGAEQLERLLDREQQERTAPLGRALDLGCGTGRHTLELAERGWTAVGVDSVERALDKARSRPDASRVRFVLGDVTDLSAASVGTGFEFVLDVGCFHGLSDEQRLRYGRAVTEASTPEATLLMLAFRPGRRIAMPRGASRSDIEAALLTWTVVAEEPADASGLPGPLKRVAPQWFRLRRR